MLLNILKQILNGVLSSNSVEGLSFDSLFSKASTLLNQGKQQEAIAVMQNILAKTPMDPEVLQKAGLFYKEIGDYQQALLQFEHYVEIKKNDANAYNEIGCLYQELGIFDDAIVHHEKAIEIQSDFYMAFNNIGNAYSATRKPELAEQAYKKAIEIKPDYAVAYNNLGLALIAQGQFKDATSAFDKAIEIDSTFALAYNNLANALQGLKEHDKAITNLEKAYSLEPDNVGILNNLGVAYSQSSLYTKSIEYYEKALKLDPKYGDVYQNIGISLEGLGRFNEAANYFKKALEIDPENDFAYTGYLFCLNYNTDLKEETIFEEHQKWGKSLITETSPSRKFNYNHAKLRIGYLSPDLRAHPVSFFIESIFEHHDNNHFDTYVYHDHLLSDKVTQVLQQHVENWRDVARLKDNELAKKILDDEIDILVELAGHTATNRMKILANRIAPIQINYLGYPNTTGLHTIDYRITDHWADPEGLTEKLHTEKLYRLPDGFLCYKPPVNSPDIHPVPAINNHNITFGCFNNSKKINAKVIKVWASVLNQVKGSRLILKSQQYKDEKLKDYFLSIFNKHNIESSRIEFISKSEDFYNHLDLYNRIDIALDPFPYNGTTTSCEALWMGVPVIALCGNVHRGRVGFSLLSQLDLADELCCDDTDEYIKRAVELANDVDQLINYRHSLRQQIKESSLTNGKIFTKALEEFYQSVKQH